MTTLGAVPSNTTLDHGTDLVGLGDDDHPQYQTPAEHDALPNPHHSNVNDHAQSHVLATGTALGPDQTISGAAAGEVLRALSPTTAAFDVLQHTDLGGVTATQHHSNANDHAAAHGITSTDHTGFPGGTTTFLRADATFAAPPGGGGEAFPVGSVFIAVVATNPGTLLGYGTWAAFGAGRVLVGLDAGQTEFDVVEETGGAKTHTLVTAEMPSHTHVQDAHSHLTQRYPTTTGTSSGFTADTSMSGTQTDNTLTTKAATATNQNTGGGGAHNNLQPYIVVYMWKRTA